ncbi:uncharacterized protein LOC143908724 isoform X2 [Temnothorax americanus]|uniref:uncharacterized protein LOC143908724 isoform X2 n=1 Tax=Temnothorax americanus TaxID=1964332 RepID=UPI004068E3DF
MIRIEDSRSQKDEEKKDSRKFEKIDEIPSEFECCFCTTKEYKDFRDAENIMPLATSDFRNPVCQEMRSFRFSSSSGNGGGENGAEHLGSLFVESKISPIQPSEMLSFARMCNKQGYNYTKTYNEQGSIDSSDTYASCQTHPSYSQGDLTEEADSNLYINPLEITEKCGTSQIKKSISGEVDRSIITNTSPSTESLKEASKANLNDMIPKHRKIRIQQVSSLKINILHVLFLKYPFFYCTQMGVFRLNT